MGIDGNDWERERGRARAKIEKGEGVEGVS